MGAKARPSFGKGYKRTKLVYGIGINDADYSITNCKIYKRWCGVLRRCCELAGNKNCYDGCTLDPRWVNFSNFRGWAETNLMDDTLVVDKDILVSGNKVYGPDTCCLVPNYVNTSISFIRKNGGDYPIGVFWSSHLKTRPFESMINTPKGRVRLGRFSSPEEAHRAWQRAKIDVIKEVISRYSEEAYFNSKVSDRLKDRIEIINSDIIYNRLTKEV
jgi:hypothetical protein